MTLVLSAHGDLVNYWRLEEGQGVQAADETGVANGALVGFPDTSFGAGDTTDLGWSVNTPGPLVPQTGQANLSSLHFGGVVSVPPLSVVNWGSSFTVEFFFNLDALPFFDAPLSFLEFRDGDSLLRLSVWEQDTVIGPQFQIVAGDEDAGPDGVFEFTPGLALAAGTWNHFSFVKAGASWAVFLNGVNVDAGAIGSGAFTFSSTGEYEIGGIFRGFDGYLDEIRISDTALDPSQFLNAIPEPSTFILVLAGLAGISSLRRRCRRFTLRHNSSDRSSGLALARIVAGGDGDAGVRSCRQAR
jgi:hypothetical protein